MKRNYQVKGFTLVELLIVIAIIGALACILTPTMMDLKERANNAADLTNIHNMMNAVNEAFMFGEDGEFYDNCWGTVNNENLGYIYVDNDEIRVSNLSIARMLQKMGYITDAEHPDKKRSAKEPCYYYGKRSRIRCQSTQKWCRYQIEFHKVPGCEALTWGITCATSAHSTNTVHEDACDEQATREMAERVGVEAYIQDLGGLN